LQASIVSPLTLLQHLEEGGVRMAYSINLDFIFAKVRAMPLILSLMNEC